MDEKRARRDVDTMTSPVKGWTDARFRTFIVSALRQAYQRFPNRNEILKKSNTKRGYFRCEGYKRGPHEVKKEWRRKRVVNRAVDHIQPITGAKHLTWDEYINRMFCDTSNLQVLCKECHRLKTNDERGIDPRMTEFRKLNAEKQRRFLRGIGLEEGSNQKLRIEIFQRWLAK